MSNLPPGVTEGMLPGNRPEDIAEEKFWDDLYERLEAEGLQLPEGWDALGSDSVWERAITIARDLGYARGFEDGRMEAVIDRTPHD